MKNNNAFDFILKKYIAGLYSAETIKKDYDYKKDNQKQLSERDLLYTGLLHEYIISYKKCHRNKEKFKWAFFIITMLCLVSLIISCFIIIIKIYSKSTEEMVAAMPILISAIVSIISSIIILPITVAKYLFNKEEDKQVSDLIIQMQSHDLENRKLIGNYESIDQKDDNNSV